MIAGPIVAALPDVCSQFDGFAQTGRGSVSIGLDFCGTSSRSTVIDYFGDLHGTNPRCGCGASLAGDCPVCGLGGVGDMVDDRLFTLTRGQVS